MGEENRDSSGSSTAMIVVAILGGLLLVGCCGGIVVIGAGGLWTYSELQVAPDRAIDPVESPISEELRQDMDSIKIPDASPLVPPAELKAPGSESLPPSPALEETKE